MLKKLLLHPCSLQVSMRFFIMSICVCAVSLLSGSFCIWAVEVLGRACVFVSKTGLSMSMAFFIEQAFVCGIRVSDAFFVALPVCEKALNVSVLFLSKTEFKY